MDRVKQALSNLKIVAEIRVKMDKLIEKNKRLQNALEKAQNDICSHMCARENYLDRPHCNACQDASKALNPEA